MEERDIREKGREERKGEGGRDRMSERIYETQDYKKLREGRGDEGKGRGKEIYGEKNIEVSSILEDLEMP